MSKNTVVIIVVVFIIIALVAMAMKKPAPAPANNAGTGTVPTGDDLVNVGNFPTNITIGDTPHTPHIIFMVAQPPQYNPVSDFKVYNENNLTLNY